MKRKWVTFWLLLSVILPFCGCGAGETAALAAYRRFAAADHRLSATWEEDGAAYAGILEVRTEADGTRALAVTYTAPDALRGVRASCNAAGATLSLDGVLCPASEDMPHFAVFCFFLADPGGARTETDASGAATLTFCNGTAEYTVRMSAGGVPEKLVCRTGKTVITLLPEAEC